MISRYLIALAILLLQLPAQARKVDDRPELVNVRDLATPAPDPTALPADTTFVLGGPGTLTGKFEDALGQPDWQGWTSIDLTQPIELYWSPSTFGAANLDTIAGNHAWWCGDVFESCFAGDPPEGVGNDWFEQVTWSGTVADSTSDCTVRVRAVLNVDTEPAYDFLYLQALRPETYGLELFHWTGVLEAYQLDESITLTPADYFPGGEVRLRWLLITDGAFSDEDCLWPTAGGCQIDNIAVSFDQGAGEVLQGEVESCEPGTPLQWTPTPIQGVGDYAQVWPQLDDLDPDQDNPTPQVAFIDDGVVEPASDGSPCITWCYGPGGFIVPPARGLGELYVGIQNEIRSPVLALPPGELGGAILAFDLYVHAPLESGAPYIAPTWRVRSTADPAGQEGWSDWRWHPVMLWGDPTWLRPRHNVTDLLVPGATHVQISLGVRNYLCCSLEDGTPAPYFDNVAFMVHDDTSPAVLHVQPDGAGEYPTIQEAIFAAAPGDTVRLADGVYTGAGNRDLNYQGKAIVIASTSGDPAACILDAEGSDADRRRVVDLSNVGGPGSVLSGVTIRGGAEQRGSGISVRYSGLTVENCILDSNVAVGTSRHGGALYGDNAALVVRDCIFRHNEADYGAAIAVTSSTNLDLSGSLFHDNKALDRGSGICRFHGPTVTVDGCTFVDNREQLNLGVISVFGTGAVQVTNTIIAFTQLGSAVHCAENGAVDLACSDLFANHAGDWIDCIADQLGQDGNFSADPLFCLDGNPDEPHSLAETSPCAAANQPSCGLIGARPVGCDSALPVPDGPPAVLSTRLLPASPNPFNPRTRIRLELAARAHVELTVFDLRGRRVRSLIRSWLAAGAHERVWDGRTDQGAAAASGTYVIRLVAGDHVSSGRVSLLK